MNAARRTATSYPFVAEDLRYVFGFNAPSAMNRGFFEIDISQRITDEEIESIYHSFTSATIRLIEDGKRTEADWRMQPIFDIVEWIGYFLNNYVANSLEKGKIVVEDMRHYRSDGTQQQTAMYWHRDSFRYFTTVVQLIGTPTSTTKYRYLLPEEEGNIFDGPEMRALGPPRDGLYSQAKPKTAIVFNSGLRSLFFPDEGPALWHCASQGKRLGAVVFWTLEGVDFSQLRAEIQQGKVPFGGDHAGAISWLVESLSRSDDVQYVSHILRRQPLGWPTVE
jgi:hypothetical protein